VLYDPLSEKVVSKKAYSPKTAYEQAPFYMRLKKIRTGLFGSEYEGNYYKLMGNFQ
jgi:hypothetical protein